MVLVGKVFIGDFLAFTAFFRTHFMVHAALVRPDRRPGDLFQLTAAVMQVNRHPHGGESINHQHCYNEKLFHLPAKVSAEDDKNDDARQGNVKVSFEV